MMKSLAVASLAFALAACASAPTAPQKAAAPTEHAVIMTAEAAKPAPGCVPDTASRIPVKDATCLGFGSVHTGDDIKNTGQTDVARALQMLDPAISAHH